MPNARTHNKLARSRSTSRDWRGCLRLRPSLPGAPTGWWQMLGLPCTTTGKPSATAMPARPFVGATCARPLTFARASGLKKVRVSGAHLPPTSTPKTTSLARARGPTGSGGNACSTREVSANLALEEACSRSFTAPNSSVDGQ